MSNAKLVSPNAVNYFTSELLELHRILEKVICTQLDWTPKYYQDVWGKNLYLPRLQENAIVDLLDAEWAGFFEKMNTYRLSPRHAVLIAGISDVTILK
jgi:hypothetical protein